MITNDVPDGGPYYVCRQEPNIYTIYSEIFLKNQGDEGRRGGEVILAPHLVSAQYPLFRGPLSIY